MTTKLRVNGGSNLGTLAMYSLRTDSRVAIQDLRDLFTQYQVPLHLIPNPLSHAGAFQRATTMVATKVVKSDCPIICKEIQSDKDYIVRTFEKRLMETPEDIEKIKEGSEGIPVYCHVATMVYNRPTGLINKCVLHPEGQEVVNRAMQNFNEINGWHNIQQIRKMIQNALRFYGAIDLRRNGGVNFIPENNTEDFGRFCKVCDQINGVEIITLDIKFTQNNKAAIAEALQEHINDSIEEEIKELNGKTTGNKLLGELIVDFSESLRNGKKIKKDGLESMLKRFKNTMQVVNEYRDLLEIDLEQTSTQIALAQKQVAAMLEKYEQEEQLKPDPYNLRTRTA